MIRQGTSSGFVAVQCDRPSIQQAVDRVYAAAAGEIFRVKAL
jgi:hypothetical protein